MTLHVVHFIKPINEKTCDLLMQCCLDAIADSASEIQIRMSSEGGTNNPGFTLANFLRNLPAKLTAHNLGAVESIAIPVFLAASTRTAEPTSRFAVHPTAWQPSNLSPTPLPTLRERVARLDNDVDRYVLAFEEATKDAEEPFDVRAALTGISPGVLNATAALRARVVHSVSSAPLPASKAVAHWIGA